MEDFARPIARALGIEKDALPGLEDLARLEIPAPDGPHRRLMRRPREEAVIGLLRAVRGERYEALVHLLLDSGARIADALRALDNLGRAVEVRPGIYKVPVGRIRGPKRCLWVYLTAETLEMLKRMPKPPSYNAINLWRRKHGLPHLKLLRKFCFTAMRRAGIYPEVARYIQGRVQGVSEECYEDLELLADEQYPLYAEYVRSLKARAQASDTE